MSSTNRQRGKAHQKKVAEMLNGIDIGILGGEDVLTDDFSIECKSVMKFVGEKWYAQCVKNNKRKKIPIVVVHIKNKSYDNDYVLININDFKKIISNT
jgi:hypothetical protein